MILLYPSFIMNYDRFRATCPERQAGDDGSWAINFDGVESCLVFSGAVLKITRVVQVGLVQNIKNFTHQLKSKIFLFIFNFQLSFCVQYQIQMNTNNFFYDERIFLLVHT